MSIGLAGSFLKPFLKDTRLWVSLVGGVLAWLNTKFQLGLNTEALATVSAGLATYAVAHLFEDKKWENAEAQKAEANKETK